MKKFRSDGGVAIAAAPIFADHDFPIQSDPQRPGRPSPMMIVEDDDEKEKQLQQHVLQRPVAVRAPGVVRPIPRRATEEFYQAAEHLPFADVHEAVMESHEWHRLYTSNQIDPTAIATTSNVPLRSSGSNANSGDSTNDDDDVVMMTPSDVIADREMGARNPSPGTREERNKRLRLSASISDVSSSSDENDDDHSPASSSLPKQQQQQEEKVVLHRPIAVRIARPKAVRPPSSSSHTAAHANNVPSDIVIAERSLSPLTLCSRGSHATQTAAHQKPLMIEEDDDLGCYVICATTTTTTSTSAAAAICDPETPIRSVLQEARDGVLHALAVSSGDATDSPQFEKCLQVLTQHYQAHPKSASSSEGMWLTLTKPTFFGNLGDNDAGDPMYTLGRMTFDMFTPSDLVCSLQGNFNSVDAIVPDDALRIPKSLRDEVSAGSSVLRTYNVVTAFTIEPPSAAHPNSPNKEVTRPIRGIMTTYGYMIADPQTPNRHSVWITGGRIDPNDDVQDQVAWKRLFGNHPPKYSVAAQARLLAVKLLMGAVLPEAMDPETGAMEYTFTRPLGGHGLAYIDTLYVDDSLRIVRGHRGTLFVFSRMPDNSSSKN